MLRKLAAYRRQNQLDLALQELGRIERTLFMLDWLESPELRRRCHAGLNKSEQRHFLAQVICTSNNAGLPTAVPRRSSFVRPWGRTLRPGLSWVRMLAQADLSVRAFLLEGEKD